MSFEKRCLKNLAEFIEAEDPKAAKHLRNISDNMIDLTAPFRAGAYYCRGMNGSYSIKQVLPALFPNDPKLDYNSLTINGVTAGREYANLPELMEKDKEKYDKIRKELYAYCELDTFAMVKVLTELRKAVRDRSSCTELCWWVRTALTNLRLESNRL